ncbi:piwi-like protein Ago3 [Penaeus indicus]|uniref:piwi-like protein Ago3 n=1 Tax=Penaeus indicus TaxID=29960 RepID=UPI00300DA357
MDGDATPPPPPMGRGGRGAAILRALQSMSWQPGTAGSSLPGQQPALPPPVVTGGAGVQTSESAGASALSSPRSPSSSSIGSSGSSRGALLYHLIKQKSGHRADSLQSPSGDSSSAAPKTAKGRGRAEILQALKVGSLTSLPGAKPLRADMQDSSSQSSSVTESMQQLNISEPQEREAVMNRGTSGLKFSATSSWIRLSVNPEKAVFEYEVKFEPQVDARNLRFHLLNTQREKLGSVKSFDGVMLWLPAHLPSEITLFHAPHPITKETITMKVVFKKRTSMDKCVQLYNVLFGRIMRILKMAKVGQNYYAPSGSVLVPQHKLEIWPGYVTAAHYREGGVMLCVDVSHRVLRTQTCYELMSEIFNNRRGQFKDHVIKALVGSIVLTRYNNQTYRIDDILFDKNPRSTFTNSKEEEVCYMDYYKNAYNITIKDPQQPLLLHRVRKKELKDQGTTKFLCLIPELCYMTGLTDDMRSDFRVMKDIAQHTRITPNVRHASLRTFVRNVNGSSEAWQVLADWGLALDDDTFTMEGRILTPETIHFGTREVPGTENADWGRESAREKVIVPVDLRPQCWQIFFTARDEARVFKFSEMIRQVTRSMGIQVGPPQMIRLPDDRIESYVNGIKQHFHERLQLAVIIFPAQREDRYSAVKRLACVDLGLPTQCINSRTISQENRLRSVTQKIALQINCKLGGELWALKIPMTGLMVCGVDVYHDPLRRGASVVGFVASTNQTLTRWFSHVSFQHPGDEIVHGLKISLLEALRGYHRQHHSLPRTIIIYRDGVSEGQMRVVEEHELPQLATIFQHFDSYEPNFSFVVVQKKISTRIFASLNSELDNPPPGSIIDHSITHRYWYDFFLVSQHVRQSTVAPTHYVVLRDGGNLKVDNMQRLAYKLTHLYYNWPGTVRVPAPCQYAHKLAYLIGQNVRKEPSDTLCDKLFFL